eukprot:592377-Hanusia_phi.AAC.1
MDLNQHVHHDLRTCVIRYGPGGGPESRSGVPVRSPGPRPDSPAPGSMPVYCQQEAAAAALPGRGGPPSGPGRSQ